MSPVGTICVLQFEVPRGCKLSQPSGEDNWTSKMLPLLPKMVGNGANVLRHSYFMRMPLPGIVLVSR